MKLYLLFKRISDIILALILLPLAFVPLVFASLLIVLSSPGPILYISPRTSRLNKTFRIYKLRTMHLDSEAFGFSTRLNDPRLIPFGRFLRKYKLDELPQLVNVLLGDMSFVGPRPQVPFYTDQYDSSLLPILSVKPGITDLATLAFADMDSFLDTDNSETHYQLYIEPKKNQYRLYYALNYSFGLDLLILFNTACILFKLPFSIPIPACP